MRRNKKAPLPVSSVAPALRRRPASASEPEAPSEASASDANSQGEPLPLPESKGGRRQRHQQQQQQQQEAAAPTAPLRAASALPAPLSQGQERRPLPAEGSREGTRGLACERGAMLGVFRSIPTQMDYKGQKLAEQIFQGIILFSAVIGFIYGYITEQFGWTVYIVMAGFALSCLLTLPPWPIYRRNPLKWLPAQEVATDDKKPADRKVKRHPKN